MVQFRDLQQDSPAPAAPHRVRDPRLSFRKLAREQQRTVPAQRAERVPKLDETRKAVYDKALLYVNEAFAAVQERKRFSLEPGFKIVREMAQVDDTCDYLFVMAMHSPDRFKYVVHHSVNVAVFAIKMAQSLGLGRTRQIEISMAAMLHDVGLGLIPDRIVYKKQELTDDEIAVVRRRPNYSYKILQSVGQEAAYLAECAAQVHERIDGSGYPRALKGEEIHEFAQIIGLLDMYEALIHTRPQRKMVPHFTALKEIFTSCKHQFARAYLKEMLKVFTLFPMFSYVQLNSGAIGKVIETYPEHPMRPKLQIVCDSQKRPVLTQPIVSLPENPLLTIVNPVLESELPQSVNR